MRITTFKRHGLGVVSLVVALSVWSCICRPGSFDCRFLWLQMKRKLQVLSAIRLDVFVCKFPTSVRLGSSCLHILKTVLMTVSKTLGSFVSTTWRLILTDEFYSCVIRVEFFTSTESLTHINKFRIYVFVITGLKSLEKTQNSTFCSAGKQGCDT